MGIIGDFGASPWWHRHKLIFLPEFDLGKFNAGQRTHMNVNGPEEMEIGHNIPHLFDCWPLTQRRQNLLSFQEWDFILKLRSADPMTRAFDRQPGLLRCYSNPDLAGA